MSDTRWGQLRRRSGAGAAARAAGPPPDMCRSAARPQPRSPARRPAGRGAAWAQSRTGSRNEAARTRTHTHTHAHGPTSVTCTHEACTVRRTCEAASRRRIWSCDSTKADAPRLSSSCCMVRTPITGATTAGFCSSQRSATRLRLCRHSAATAPSTSSSCQVCSVLCALHELAAQPSRSDACTRVPGGAATWPRWCNPFSTQVCQAGVRSAVFIDAQTW